MSRPPRIPHAFLPTLLLAPSLALAAGLPGAALASRAAGVAQGQEPGRLVLVDLEGRESTVSAAGLELSDPRERGAWIVRPTGFAVPQPTPDVGPRAVLTLHGGDELRGRVSGGAGEALELALLGDVRVPIDIAHLSAVDFPDAVPAAESLALEAAPEGDRLYRRTGAALDPVDGTIEGFDATGVVFHSVLGQRTIPWNEVGALRIEAFEEAPATGASDAPPVQIDLADGSRLRGELLGLRDQRCLVRLGGEHVASLPLGAVAELTVADGRLTHLSELTPGAESGRGTPFDDELGMSWPHRMDSSVVGSALTCDGQVFRRGIGMHAPSRLPFALDGGYRALRGRVGIDDSTRIHGAEARGLVVFRVWTDGRKAWESGPVRGGEAPVAFGPLELSGVKELVLEVDPAGEFFGDRADWLRPVLTR